MEPGLNYSFGRLAARFMDRVSYDERGVVEVVDEGEANLSNPR